MHLRTQLSLTGRCVGASAPSLVLWGGGRSLMRWDLVQGLRFLELCPWRHLWIPDPSAMILPVPCSSQPYVALTQAKIVWEESLREGHVCPICLCLDGLKWRGRTHPPTWRTGKKENSGIFPHLGFTLSGKVTCLVAGTTNSFGGLKTSFSGF